MAASLASTRREQSRERRRRQLIDATIKCISRKGLGSTTLADVAKEAGLSQGIVNLHFTSKDNLLAETLRFLAEEYDEHFEATLAATEGGPAEKLFALMALDLKPKVCDRQKLAVWFAFWGEVKAVPTYQNICAKRDQKYADVMEDLTRAIVAEGGYDVDPVLMAEALGSLTDGMWLSCIVNPKSFDRRKSLEAVQVFLVSIFPEHYQSRS